jgi:hypothetical protein
VTSITVVAAEGEHARLAPVLAGAADLCAPGEPLPRAPWVLVLDGLSDAEVGVLEAALGDAQVQPVAVQGPQWDGFVPIPLAGLCRGLVCGFGDAGVVAAIQALEGEAGQRLP